MNQTIVETRSFIIENSKDMNTNELFFAAIHQMTEQNKSSVARSERSFIIDNSKDMNANDLFFAAIHQIAEQNKSASVARSEKSQLLSCHLVEFLNFSRKLAGRRSVPDAPRTIDHIVHTCNAESIVMWQEVESGKVLQDEIWQGFYTLFVPLRESESESFVPITHPDLNPDFFVCLANHLIAYASFSSVLVPEASKRYSKSVRLFQSLIKRFTLEIKKLTESDLEDITEAILQSCFNELSKTREEIKISLTQLSDNGINKLKTMESLFAQITTLVNLRQLFNQFMKILNPKANYPAISKKIVQHSLKKVHLNPFELYISLLECATSVSAGNFGIRWQAENLGLMQCIVENCIESFEGLQDIASNPDILRLKKLFMDLNDTCEREKKSRKENTNLSCKKEKPNKKTAAVKKKQKKSKEIASDRLKSIKNAEETKSTLIDTNCLEIVQNDNNNNVDITELPQVTPVAAKVQASHSVQTPLFPGFVPTPHGQQEEELVEIKTLMAESVVVSDQPTWSERVKPRKGCPMNVSKTKTKTSLEHLPPKQTNQVHQARLNNPMAIRKSVPQPSESSPKCVICIDALVQIAILPCFHACLCVSCANKFHSSAIQTFGAGNLTLTTQCPICRNPIHSIKRLFFS